MSASGGGGAFRRPQLWRRLTDAEIAQARRRKLAGRIVERFVFGAFGAACLLGLVAALGKTVSVFGWWALPGLAAVYALGWAMQRHVEGP